ncbi:MAG TPA: nuclear transport factor 2 family protein [Candidatus Dormibacteraeota bacterium]|jgi:ketosteroid isomerase-like protein
MTSGPVAVVERLQAAINARDLEALLSCFDPEVTSTQPAHPARNFTGSAQVRQNWAQIFAGVPDISAELLRYAAQDDTVWAEWAWTGTRRDGNRFEMRGVTIQAVGQSDIKRVTFYMEPLETAGPAVSASVGQAVGGRQ